MSTAPRYERGAFCWVGLATADVEGAKWFYSRLFGWRSDEVGAADAFTVLCHGDEEVAILYRQTPEAHAAGVVPHWTPYILVEDADATATRVDGLGADVLREPFDALGQGRAAPIRDPTGAIVSLWQPRRRAGPTLVNDVGSLGWVELATTDREDGGERNGRSAGSLHQEICAAAHSDLGRSTVVAVRSRCNRQPTTSSPRSLLRRGRGERIRSMSVLRRGRDAKVGLLGDVSLFSACSNRELARIASLADEVDVPEGRVLTRQGDPGREFFVIVEGRAKVSVRGKRTSTLGPGSAFGEMSLLDQGPRTATVTALTDMQLLVLDSRSFYSLISEVPSVAAKIFRAMAKRLREAENNAMH
jgi:CRP/FNR family transcriptional regulator, cyclic AMP receptor protein